MSRDRSTGHADASAPAKESSQRVAPGKVTLTQGLPSVQRRESDAGAVVPLEQSEFVERPVQQRARAADHDDPFGMHLIQRQGESDNAGGDAAVHEAAVHGLATQSSPLPFADQIQRSFGRHDVSGVQAHVGGEASKASAAMGATAYATGDHVVFGAQPDLHTAAHEAAHTIQQRGGVQLKGGVGKKGDTYEKHADEVADKVVRGESAESLLDVHAGSVASSTTGAVQCFGADEHEFMGNMGSGGATVTLAPGYTLTYGEMVALAGDHFSSIEQMREFAANMEGGRGSRLEIEYARKWKLGKKVKWMDGWPKYEEAKAAQEARYYTLAGGNISHFPNPREGDMDRSTPEKAVDGAPAKDDRRRSDKPWMMDSWATMYKGTGAIANYRRNHFFAIGEAWQAGKGKLAPDEALARDGFASHYLTDSFAGGHVRTERLGAKEYWDTKVPQFYENLVSVMADKITDFLRARGSDVKKTFDMPWIDTPIPSIDIYPDADHVPREKVFNGARDKVRAVFEAKSKLTLGDVVALAIHGNDNKLGVLAHVDGKQKRLFGDGQILQGGKQTEHGKGTADAAIAAVAKSVEDVRTAHQLGAAGQSLEAVVSQLIGDDKMFAPERLLPVVTQEDRADWINPELKWKFDSADELLASPRMVAAIKGFLEEQSGELEKAGLKGDEQLAVEDLAKKMKGDPVPLLKEVINWNKK